MTEQTTYPDVKEALERQAEEEPRTKVLANGAVYDLDTHRIVKGADLTSEEARDMRETRKAKYHAVIDAGIAQGAAKKLKAPVATGPEGYQHMVAAVTETALEPGSRQQVQAFRSLTSLLNLETADEEDGVSFSGHISGESLKELVGIMDRARALRAERVGE